MVRLQRVCIKTASKIDESKWNFPLTSVIWRYGYCFGPHCWFTPHEYRYRIFRQEHQIGIIRSAIFRNFNGWNISLRTFRAFCSQMFERKILCLRLLILWENTVLPNALITDTKTLPKEKNSHEFKSNKFLVLVHGTLYTGNILTKCPGGLKKLHRGCISKIFHRDKKFFTGE